MPSSRRSSRRHSSRRASRTKRGGSRASRVRKVSRQTSRSRASRSARATRGGKVRASRASRSPKGGKLRLVKLSRSPKKEKKYRAHFSDGTHTDFGAAGMSDYTKHKDASRKDRYLKRHAKRENWRNMKSPGALSRYILWNKPSLRASLADYKRRFG